MIGVSNQIAISNSASAPFGNTGSPGDNGTTCSKPACHVNTVNSGPGSLSINLGDIPSHGYTPGRTYDITVNLSESGRMTYGFSLTAEKNNGDKVGSYQANSDVLVTFQNWVTHRSTSGTGTWTFKWTAPPSDVQDITFYVAGNAANGNGLNSGDHIYTASETIEHSPWASVQDVVKANEIRIYFDEKLGGIRIESRINLSVSLFNLSGQKIDIIDIQPGSSTFKLNHLEPGIYILANAVRGFSNKIVVL